MRVIFVAIVISFFHFACNIDTTNNKEATKFSFSDSTSDFMTHETWIFDDYFIYFDTLDFVGDYVCTTIINGYIDTVFSQDIKMRIECGEDTTVNHPLNSNIFSVIPQKETLVIGESTYKATYFIKNNPESYDIFFYSDNNDKLIGVDSIDMQFFPKKPVSGYVLDSLGNDVISSNNSWHTHGYSVFMMNLSDKVEGSFTHIIGAFALEALGMRPYFIGGVGYRDGLDVTTYHQFFNEYLENGKTIKLTGRSEERRYIFKYEGLREIYYKVSTEKSIGDETFIRKIQEYRLYYNKL